MVGKADLVLWIGIYVMIFLVVVINILNIVIIIENHTMKHIILLDTKKLRKDCIKTILCLMVILGISFVIKRICFLI